MEKIELSPNDKKDLLELLDYAKEKKKNDDISSDRRDHFKMSGWWDIRIEQLKMIVNGYVPNPSHIQSSMNTIDMSMNKSDLKKFKYRQSLESELNDFIEYLEERKD